MKFKITERKHVEYDTPFKFPIIRKHTISEDEVVYWKFESHHKVTRIHEKMSETSILNYDDPNIDFVCEMITSEKMLFGQYEYDRIDEVSFDMAIQRLIDILYKA